MNIIFDLDGTLIDASERLYRLFQYLVPESDLSKDEYWELKRNRINHKMILERYFSNIDFDKFNSRWLELIETDKYLAMDCLYHDTIKTLEILSKKCSLILLTARQSKEKLIFELKRLEIYEFFDIILATEAKKSKEDLLEETVNFRRSLHDIFVSDTGKDIKLGNKMSFFTIAITHGFMCRELLEEYKPNLLVKELFDIRSFIFV